jgi:hypothetical protein
VFTARYALSSYIKQIRFVFKGLRRTLSGYLSNTQRENLKNGINPSFHSYDAFKVPFCVRNDFHLREKAFVMNICFLPFMTKMSNFVPCISLMFQNGRLILLTTTVCRYIRIILKCINEIGCKAVERIHVAHDRQLPLAGYHKHVNLHVQQLEIFCTD